jgi:anti-anti-sigma factor
MTLELPEIETHTMTATAKLETTTIAVRLAGTADTEIRPNLDQFVQKLHAEAVRIGVANVTVDLRELEFMNSSCLKVFVTWLAKLRDLEASKQYRIQIRSNPQLLWQRRSLAALSCFAADLVTIET